MLIRFAVLVVACSTLAFPVTPAVAQSAGPGQAGPIGPGMQRQGGQHRLNDSLSDGNDAPLTAMHDPWPRLDAGALLCGSEADLQQHQAAVLARFHGETAPEPQGCRHVRYMTPVTVVERHGLARTEVRLSGAAQQVGWTDAMISTRPPPGR